MARMAKKKDLAFSSSHSRLFASTCTQRNQKYLIIWLYLSYCLNDGTPCKTYRLFFSVQTVPGCLNGQEVQSEETYFRFLTDNADHYSLSVLAIYGDKETVSGSITVPTLENATQWVDDMGEYWASFDIPNPDFPEQNEIQTDQKWSHSAADFT